VRWMWLVLVAAACAPKAAPQPTRGRVIFHAPARAVEPEAEVAPAPEEALDQMDLDITSATMFCVESREHDCPGGFACVEGACEPASL
jgi:hypothetical protein